MILGMFDKTQYIIEENAIRRLIELRKTFTVKDTNGKLLGYVKWQRFKPNFWFEGTDGIRLSEVYTANYRFKVYDAQKRLRGALKIENPWKVISFPGWLIEDPEGLQLAKVELSKPSEVALVHGAHYRAEYQILSPEGEVFAQIIMEQWFTGLFRGSYRITILRQDLDPLLVLSYVIVLAWHLEMTRGPLPKIQYHKWKFNEKSTDPKDSEPQNY